MRKTPATLEYEITSHPHLIGVRLSLAGAWGNQPFIDAASAERTAHIDAAGKPMTITYRSFGSPAS